MRRCACCRGLLVCAGVVCILAGCGEQVQEDRSITWAPDGQASGFQHGEEGVFVAERDSDQLTKVFSPEADVLATSTPLWSTDGQRLIFATARLPEQPDPHNQQNAPDRAKPDESASLQEQEVSREETGSASSENQVQATVDSWDDNPAGRHFWQVPVVYTCWMATKAADGTTSDPVEVFEASCNHVGYVAANLAVRWAPQGNRIYYLDETGSTTLGVFQYDLDSKTSQRAFPHDADAILFDPVPGGEELVCVLANWQAEGAKSGIWIGQPGKQKWWHVPHSNQFPETARSSAIEWVRSLRPAWSRDREQFVFTVTPPADGQDVPELHRIYRAAALQKQVDLVLETDQPIRDLHWSPDGKRLGFVRGEPIGSLLQVKLEDGTQSAVTNHPIRRFAGWDAGGGQLCYIVPDGPPPTEPDRWNFLIAAHPHARDAVYLADDQRDDSEKIVFSGLRVTFPLWSPDKPELSLWATFVPSYQSIFSRWFWWGLRPGDPAAVLDPATGEMRWMTVNAREQAQVGHYYLLKKNYEEAWRRYEQANRDKPARRATLQEFLSADYWRDELAGFEYLCLKRLGRNDEAAARLADFRTRRPLGTPADAAETESGTPPPTSSEAASPSGNEATTGDAAAAHGVEAAHVKLVTRLLQDLYLAEVFLSLDAAYDAQNFFDSLSNNAESDAERLSAAIVSSQLLLLEKQHVEYAELATETIGPLLIEVWPDETAREEAGASTQRTDLDELVTIAAWQTLLPMFSTEFVSTLPQPKLELFVQVWESTRRSASYDTIRLVADLILAALYESLGSDNERKFALERIAQNKARERLLPAGGVTAQLEESRRLRGLSGP